MWKIRLAAGWGEKPGRLSSVMSWVYFCSENLGEHCAQQGTRVLRSVSLSGDTAPEMLLLGGRAPRRENPRSTPRSVHPEQGEDSLDTGGSVLHGQTLTLSATESTQA